MQQPGPMFPVLPSFPPTNITTDQIQKYLDENKKLILAILDNQNLGKLAECAQYQAHLQKNLMYLAAIADAQPQTPAMATQMAPPHPAMQQGGFYMPHHLQAGSMHHPGGSLFSPRGPPFASPNPMQDQPTAQAQAQMGLARPPIGPNNDTGQVVGPSSNSSLKPDKATSSDAAQGNSPAREGDEA